MVADLFAANVLNIISSMMRGGRAGEVAKGGGRGGRLLYVKIAGSTIVIASARFVVNSKRLLIIDGVSAVGKIITTDLSEP